MRKRQTSASQKRTKKGGPGCAGMVAKNTIRRRWSRQEVLENPAGVAVEDGADLVVAEMLGAERFGDQRDSGDVERHGDRAVEVAAQGDVAGAHHGRRVAQGAGDGARVLSADCDLP